MQLIDVMDRFIKDADSKELAVKAEVVTCWDFNTALGCTLTDKLESIHVSIVGVSNVLIKKWGQWIFLGNVFPRSSDNF